jgi:uncharacterized membrane protein SpoIIM required for sporulation
MTDSFDKQPSSSATEIDEMKRMLTETNPILLITTMIVTLLHGLFEILAFKVSGEWGVVCDTKSLLSFVLERYHSLEEQEGDGWGFCSVRCFWKLLR